MAVVARIPLSRITAVGEAKIIPEPGGVRLITAPKQWAYGAEVSFDIPGIESDSRVLKICLEVESGVLGVGWLDEDQTDWITRASATRSAKELSLTIPARTPGKLIFDNWTEGDEPARGMIQSITVLATRTVPMSDRYAVSIRMAGLGDRLISLCAAWLFARSTDRTLVADWRHSVYTPTSNMNLFPFCFEPQREIAGVPFIGDDLVQQIRLPYPRHPEIWNDDRVLQQSFMRAPGGLEADRNAAVDLIQAGVDVLAPTVVFDACLSDAVVSWQDAKAFLGDLRPVRHLQDQVSAFREAHFQSGPVIGLHIRHGNGGNIGSHAPYWESFDTAIERCRIAVDLARTRLGCDAPVLLCTDSIEVQRALSKPLSGLVSRHKAFRAPGSGDLEGALGRNVEYERDDSLVEMLLLAQCDALIRYPPSSFFSLFAAVMKPSRMPPPDTVSMLACPCDPSDALSAAVLL